MSGNRLLDEVMALYPENQSIQRVQTAHRLKLIEQWRIPAGARVLEIGCGQGDTTAALAVAVGERGFVHGVDIASPDYGAPETLGQARERLLQSPIGGRIRMDLETDVLQHPALFREQEFDVAVLAHCLWYLASPQTLRALLTVVRPWCKRLALAEWDPRPVAPEQLAHAQAVQIQAICESFRSTTHSNIRTLFYPRDIVQAVADAGYTVEASGTVASPDLQDGCWEVAATAEEYPAVVRQSGEIPARLRALLFTQIEELQKAETIRPLPVFWLIAEA